MVIPQMTSVGVLPQQAESNWPMAQGPVSKSAQSRAMQK
jgi:hypothetical protein